MEILCNLKNINLSFGTKSLFLNAELIIHFGERIGLLGLNGTGKSSLFKILAEEIIPDNSSPPFEFSKASGRGQSDKKYSAFYIPQDINVTQDDSVTIKQFVFRFYPSLKNIQNELEQLNHLLEKQNNKTLIEKQKNLLEEFDHLNGWKISQGYESYLKVFGLTDWERPVYSLSGGEQKKILLSLGLSAFAHLILWDEPTNHIDSDTISLFEGELLDSKNAFILVTHDRSLLSRVTNRIFHIRNGRIDQFFGSYPDYLELLKDKEAQRQKLVTRLSNTLKREDAWMKQGIKARGTRSKKRVENFLDLKNTIGHLKNDAKKTINFNIAHSKRETKKLIEFQSMSFSYGEKDLFTNINLTINKKEKIGLLGPNGIGKTTLVKLIEGSLTPSSGYRKAAENLIIKHFTQKRDELDPEMTPYQLLGEGTDHVTLNGYKQHVITYFESFLFKSTEIHRPLKSFSGGEKNRLQLAFNLKQAGDLLIFDEPTNDLDLETLEILEKKLEEHEGALVVISHDRSFLANVTNTTWLIADSKIEFFQAGYSQVEDYLEALRIEHELLQKEDKKIELSRPTPTVDDPKRLTNKQKERLKTIDMDIHNKEATLESLEMKLGEFDYSNMDQEKTIKLQKLHEQRDQIELELLDLYEEMGTLNSST